MSTLKQCGHVHECSGVASPDAMWTCTTDTLLLLLASTCKASRTA